MVTDIERKTCGIKEDEWSMWREFREVYEDGLRAEKESPRG